MMKKLGIFLCLTFVSILKSTQPTYTTPGSGVHWSLDSLVAHSSGAVTGGNHSFTLHQSVTVAGHDTLRLFPGDTLYFNDQTGQLELKVNGALLAPGSPEDSIIISSLNKNYGDYWGIVYRDTIPGSVFQLNYCRIEYATRAVRIIGADGIIQNCRIQHNAEAAISLTTASPVIRRNRIHHNRQYALIMSVNSSPVVEGNVFTENNFENASPYVIITVGLQGVNSPIIRNNTILGQYSRSGGIAIWGQSNALIEGNHIENCAYGIFCYQSGANPVIRNNILLNNNINPDTLYFGFGIACNGSNAPIITGNQIQGHFYGVAIVNGGHPNLGNLNNADTTDDGRNLFLGNGIGNRRYELYNNSSSFIWAENNWWGTNHPDSIEARIVHQPDNPALGMVDYLPFLEQNPLRLTPAEPEMPRTLELYAPFPNPFNATVVIPFSVQRPGHYQIKVFNLLGQSVATLLDAPLVPGSYSVTWDGHTQGGGEASSGIYLLLLRRGAETDTERMLLIR